MWAIAGQTPRTRDAQPKAPSAGWYDSARWRREAKRFKQMYPLCGTRPGGQPPVMSRCADAGLLTPAYQVDHVRPHRGDLTLFWDQRNWQSLCRACGGAKSKAGL